MLAANWIRQAADEKDLKLKLGFFLHIPFPPWDIFRLFPWADEILQGMLGKCHSLKLLALGDIYGSRVRAKSIDRSRTPMGQPRYSARHFARAVTLLRCSFRRQNVQIHGCVPSVSEISRLNIIFSITATGEETIKWNCK